MSVSITINVACSPGAQPLLGHRTITIATALCGASRPCRFSGLGNWGWEEPWTFKIGGRDTRACLEFQCQEDRARNGVKDVGLDGFEAQRRIQVDGRRHGGNRIEADARVARRARFRADPFREAPPQPLTPRLRPHVQALHFAGKTLQGAQGYAAKRFLAAPGQQEPPLGRCIFARQTGKFGFESLEAEVNVQTPGIFAEQAAHFVKVARDFGRP